MARIKPEFDKRGVKIVGLSVDSVDNHAKWSKDIAAIGGVEPSYPMIGDTDLKVAKLYGMLPTSASGNSATRTPADNATVRTVYVIGPDKLVKAMIVYPMNTGRNLDEVLRLVDSVQLTANAKVATPVNWKQGEDVIIPPAIQEAEARERFPAGWKAPLPYMRVVPQPHA
jgi:alkyl hydroperoxide reductase subunit AhpC